VDCLTKKLIEDGIVSVDEREVIRYGLENLGSTLLGFFLTFLVGFGYGSVFTGVTLWLLLFPLRKHAGGYHAKTKKGCFFTSTVMLIAVFSVLYVHNWSCGTYGVIVTCFGYFIFWIAPLSNPNKNLDLTEKKVYRARTRMILLLECALFFLAYLLSWRAMIVVIAMCFVTMGTSLVMGLVMSLK
jgi:accessory gene regulator B